MSEITMRERIARRLCTCDEQSGGPPWDHPIHESHARYFEYADAVLAEMERPSIEMRKVCSFETAEVEYPAMIRAARAGR